MGMQEQHFARQIPAFGLPVVAQGPLNPGPKSVSGFCGRALVAAWP